MHFYLIYDLFYLDYSQLPDSDQKSLTIERRQYVGLNIAPGSGL